MENAMQNMRPDERSAFRLRRLYESRGYKRVCPGKFEEHSLYIENKNFLQAKQIISFMDMDGKLRALKPDVTLSVVKNVPDGPLHTFQKLYYLDEVYRVSPENREYKAQAQIGVELIGPADVFANIEVVDLALLSLEAIGENYVLDISHLGFVSGLLSSLHLPHLLEKQVVGAIHAKSIHELQALLEDLATDETVKARILLLADLHGGLSDTLPRAKSLVINEEMKVAYEELETVANALDYNGFGGKLNLDFSVVNDLDYYNSLIFRGYVERIPQSILTGGRYDNLMKKMGKKSGATGFAVSLDDLNTYIPTGRQYDFDLLITYDAEEDWKTLLKTVKELTDKGESVRLERADADLAAAAFSWKRHCRFSGKELIEERRCETC